MKKDLQSPVCESGLFLSVLLVLVVDNFFLWYADLF